MRVRTRAVAGLLASLLSVAVAGCGSGSGGGGDNAQSGGSSSGPVTVRIAHNSNAAALPAQVALAKGFFKKQGLNVTFKQIEDVATLPPALDKSFDIVLSAPTLEISATAHGIPMVVVSGGTVSTKDNPTAAVIASRASGITNISQMAGKTLGSLSPTGTIGIGSLYMMKKAGVDISKVHVIALNGPQQTDQMAAGRVDAVVSVAPFTNQLMALPGSVNLGDPYQSLSSDLSGINWASSKKYADAHAATIKKFNAAMAEAITYIGANDADARKILQSYTQLPDAVAAKTVFPTYRTEVRKSDLDRWLTAMQQVSDFKDKVNTSQMVASS